MNIINQPSVRHYKKATKSYGYYKFTIQENSSRMTQNNRINYGK